MSWILTPTFTMSSLLVQPQRNILKTFEQFLISSLHMVFSSIPSVEFCVKEQNFLVHHIDRQEITHFLEKVKAIHDFPQSQSQQQFRLFKGLVLRSKYSSPHTILMKPLHAHLSMTKPKFQTFTWTNSALTIFTAYFRSYPDSDLPTCLMTDASDTAAGDV